MNNFKYLTDKKFGKSRYVKEGPCYRTIICAAFLHYHTLNKCEQTLITKIQELIECFYDTKEFSLSYENEHNEHNEVFLEIYPVLMKELWGFLVVDHTGGCFPLVIYPYTNKYFDNTPNAARCAGLLRTIENIEKEKERLVNLIVKYENIYDGQTDLTYDDFQDELHSFIYSTRKRQK